MSDVIDCSLKLLQALNDEDSKSVNDMIRTENVKTWIDNKVAVKQLTSSRDYAEEYEIMGHSDGKYILINEVGGGQLSPQQLYDKIIISEFGYVHGEDIRLYSCYTGGEFAKALSAITGGTVYAPTGLINVDSAGAVIFNDNSKWGRPVVCPEDAPCICSR